MFQFINHPCDVDMDGEMLPFVYGEYYFSMRNQAVAPESPFQRSANDLYYCIHPGAFLEILLLSCT